VGRSEARSRVRHAPGRVPRSRLAREQVHGGALHRELRRRRGRLRRHARAARGASPGRADHPQRSRGRRARLPLDLVRGQVGTARARVLQRADRSEPEDAVDGADRMVEALAGPELRGANERRSRDGRDRLLLRRRRGRLARARQPSAEPRTDAAAARRAARTRDFRRDPHPLAAGNTAQRRPAADVGSDPLVGGPGVSVSRRPLPRDRAALPPAGRSDLGTAGADPRRVRARRSRHDGRGGRGLAVPRRGRRDDAHAARSRARPGGLSSAASGSRSQSGWRSSRRPC